MAGFRIAGSPSGTQQPGWTTSDSSTSSEARRRS